MSKKKFTSGLEKLFGNVLGDDLNDENPLLEKTEEEVVATEEKPVKKPRRRSTKPARKKRSSGKSFSTDLESLFTQVVNEVIDEKSKQSPSVKRNADKIRKKVKPLSGLDALIRRTSLADHSEDDHPTDKKRVTFVFDKHKLIKLKTIARKEKAYLKDIIGAVISEYIDQYEDENGDVVE